MNYKISIIIPAYNVSLYIKKCVESVINQTYKNIEIIVVNDGSTDNTGQILDNLSLKDKRIKIVHQKNLGVSSARNTGLEFATGDFVTFVDGDDYLAKDFIDYMLKIEKETAADLCFSIKSYTKKEERQNKNLYIKPLSPEEGTILLISPEIIVGCWNKMYRKALIDKYNIRFNKDLFYGEGLNFITTFSQRANIIGIGNKRVYYYRKSNINSATTKFNIEKFYNGEKAINIIKNNLIIKTKRVNDILDYHLCLFSLGAVVRIKAAKKEKEYYEEYYHWNNYVKKTAFKFLFSKDLSLYRKLLVICGAISPWIMTKLDIVRRKKIIKNSVINN